MNNYTVSFSKQDFINAVAILGFENLYAIDTIENKGYRTYTNSNKAVYIEIKQNPFSIIVLSKGNTFMTGSYESAYSKIHELIT